MQCPARCRKDCRLFLRVFGGGIYPFTRLPISLFFFSFFTHLSRLIMFLSFLCMLDLDIPSYPTLTHLSLPCLAFPSPPLPSLRHSSPFQTFPCCPNFPSLRRRRPVSSLKHQKKNLVQVSQRFPHKPLNFFFRFFRKLRNVSLLL